jgi:peptidoglycan-N-acetylmuramic acid deacetylase
MIYSVCIFAVTLMFLLYYGIGLNLAKAPGRSQPVKDRQQLSLNKVPENKNNVDITSQSGISADKTAGNAKASEDNAGIKKTEKQSETKFALQKKLTDKSSGKPIRKTITRGPNTSMISVTFDDGYNKKDIEKVLDVLKKNNIKTTFFIIGKVLTAYPDLWKRAVNDGHQICNHTEDHEILTKASDARVRYQIQGWERSVKKVLGDAYLVKMKKEFPYLRLPGGGGEKSDRILSIAQENGYTVIGWNLETYSSIIRPYRKTLSVKEISNKIERHVVNKCSKGSIILLHFNPYDSGNIDGIIQGIKKRGFNMQPISELIK